MDVSWELYHQPTAILLDDWFSCYSASWERLVASNAKHFHMSKSSQSTQTAISVASSVGAPRSI